MHTVKGKKITVIHFSGPAGFRIFLLNYQRKEITSAGRAPAGLSPRATVGPHWDPGEGSYKARCNLANLAASAQLSGFWEFQEHQAGPRASVGAAAPPREGGPTEKVQCGLFGNARKRGRREEGGGWRVSPGTGIGPRFCSSVPHHQEGSLTGFMQGQGRGQRGAGAALPAIRSQGQGGTHGSGPGTLREPFAGSSVHGKGRGTCTWLVREEKVPHTKSNNQRHVWQPPCRPAPLPSAGSAASTHTHCPGGRREGGAVPSVSRAISLAPLHCRLACDCQEPPDRDPVPGHHSPPLLRQVNNCCCF